MILEENQNMSSENEDQETANGNPAMADAMRRVLNTGKNSSKKSIILAKAKVLNKKSTLEKKPKDPGFEIEKGPEEESKDEVEIKEEADDIKPDKELIKRKRIKVRYIPSYLEL